MIALIDYKAGNLTSVRKALASVGASVFTPERPADLEKSEGIIVPAGWWPDAKTFGNEHFVSAFLAKNGGDPSSIGADSAEAYSVGQVVQQAVDHIDSIDNAKLIDALHQGTYRTVQGSMAFDAVGKPTGQSFLVQWQNGSAVPVYPPAVAVTRPEYPKPAWP